MRRTGNVFLPAIPAAAIVLAGLVEATFEDGLFAVGYYLCVLVWALAFILEDLVHDDDASVHAPEPSIPVYWNGMAAASPGQ